MKIGFLVKDISANGGVERVVITLANNLSKIYNYKIKIISIGKKVDKHIFELNKGIDIKYLNYNKYKSGTIIDCFKELIFIERRLRKENIDILISTTTFHNVYLAFLKPILKFKVIASHHEEYLSDTNKWNKLKKIFYRNLDNIILLTKSDYNIYKNYNSNSHVIPNAVPFKSEYLYDINSKKILTISRLSIEKSIEYSIESFSKLADKYPDWTLEIVGEGPDKDRLMEIIKEFNLESKVSITGFCNNVKDKYKSAAFTMLTSQKEGFGCVLIESNAVGVPVVSFDNVGPKEIIKDGVNGFLVEKNNSNHLTKTMDKLMSDNKLREKLSIQSYNISSKYNIENICDRWNKVINGGN